MPAVGGWWLVVLIGGGNQTSKSSKAKRRAPSVTNRTSDDTPVTKFIDLHRRVAQKGVSVPHCEHICEHTCEHKFGALTCGDTL